MRLVSVKEKLDKLKKLKSNDVTVWEWKFICNMQYYESHEISDNQWEIVEQIYSKHFS